MKTCRKTKSSSGQELTMDVPFFRSKGQRSGLGVRLKPVCVCVHDWLSMQVICCC